MYFHKFRHPSNFTFASGCVAILAENLPQAAGNTHSVQFGARSIAATVRDLGEDVFHVELRDEQRWPLDARLVRMLDSAFAYGPASTHRLAFSNNGDLALAPIGQTVTTTPVLSSVPGAGIGVCGSAWLMQCARDDEMRFFGQGEKVTGLEKSGKRTKFWNADVWADHAMSTIQDGQADPQYAAIPYLLMRRGRQWVGILVDHPGAVFMDTGSNWFFFGKDDHRAPPAFWFGADQGVPAFYLITADSAALVTQRLQRLVGTTPLPPLWSLGHHQSRWGYAGPKELNRLDAAFTAHDFPNDGLWLDIDYMDNYKVFTTDGHHFQDLRAELAALHANGRRIVPILDPGVKVDAKFEVAHSGQAADIFCQNPEGQAFVGFVWPGRTWFPDFSLPEGRDWWAANVKQFREAGFDAAWLDMNDPSTGAAELDDMLFQRGSWPHWTYHNQYATGMAEASRAGFLAACPDERPFLLSRSAAAGSSRYTALWTGDNFSSWHHLRTSIHTSINLALSGLPFNGPDVPGFGGHADKELAIAWYKAGCLFPFFRNHACAGTADQEPWAFGAEAMAIIRHHIRLRYKLLPYLYQLWVAQAAIGAAVMRPLFHDFENEDGFELDRVDDQFLIGPDLMQAPLVHAGQQQRWVVLPGRRRTGALATLSCIETGLANTTNADAGDGTMGGNGSDQSTGNTGSVSATLQRWLDVASGQFVQGGRTVSVTSSAESTPIYLREGSIIPMQTGVRSTNANDLSDIELHVILGRGCTATAILDYVADDGLTFAHERGERTRLRITARREADVLRVSIEALQSGWKAVRFSVVGYDGASHAMVATGRATFVQQSLTPFRWIFSGAQ